MESIKELKIVCQNMDYKEVLFVRLYARRISIYFTKLFLLARVSANQVTLLNLLLGLVIGLIFVLEKGIPIGMLISSLLLHPWIILDHYNGEVARYRKAMSITVHISLLITKYQMRYILIKVTKINGYGCSLNKTNYCLSMGSTTNLAKTRVFL